MLVGRSERAEKQTLLRMDFSTFPNTLVNIPAQIVRTSRQIVYRFSGLESVASVFFRLLDAISRPLRC